MMVSVDWRLLITTNRVTKKQIDVSKGSEFGATSSLQGKLCHKHSSTLIPIKKKYKKHITGA